jgi:hypothetical protein
MSQSPPFSNSARIQSTHGEVTPSDVGTDQAAILQNIQENVELLKQRPDLDKEIQKRVQNIEGLLLEVKQKVEDPRGNVILKEIKAMAGRIDPNVEDVTAKLQILNNALEDAKVRAEQDTDTLEFIKTGTDYLLAHSKIDSAALQQLEESLDELKNRPPPLDPQDYGPALQSLTEKFDNLISSPVLGRPFTDLVADIQGLKEAVGSHNTTVTDLLHSLQQDLQQRPGLNMVPEQLFERFDTIQRILESQPVVNQDEIMEELNAIRDKVNTVDFPALVQGLNTIDNKVTQLVDRPYLDPHGMTQQFQRIHDGMNSLREIPILKNDPPLLTEAHFDNTMSQLVEGLQNRPIDQKLLEGVQGLQHDVHDLQHDVQAVASRPEFDPAQITALANQLEEAHNEDKTAHGLIVSRIEDIHGNEGPIHSGLNRIEDGVKLQVDEIKDQHDLNSADVGKKLDLLTKLTVGMAIAGGVTIIGALAWKLFKGILGGNKGNEKEAAKRLKARIHAREWSGAREPLVSRSLWDGEISPCFINY